MTEQDIQSLYSEIGLRIKKFRQDKGIKQEAFAKMLNLTRASIVNIEKGRQRASIHLLYKICKITGVSIMELLPDLPSEDQLSPKWQKIMQDSSYGAFVNESKLSEFLAEITSKEQK